MPFPHVLNCVSLLVYVCAYVNFSVCVGTCNHLDVSNVTSKSPTGYNITYVNKKFIESNVQNSRIDIDISLPVQSFKILL